MSGLKRIKFKIDWEDFRVFWTIFSISVLLLVVMFPHKGKFKYEYQKGKPWMHQVLVAPFDVPVYKTDDELSYEKDSISRHFIPYFTFNPKIGLEKKEQFWQAFNKKLQYTNEGWTKDTVVRKQLELLVKELIDTVYSKGIVNIPDEGTSILHQSSTIAIIRDNEAEDVDANTLFTPKSAYEFIFQELIKFSDQIAFTDGVSPFNFFKNLKIEKYIIPNLFYDAATSQKVKDQALANISLTQGMVLSGERIIFTGDIVTPRHHKVLESVKKEYEQRMGFSANYIFILLGQAIIVLTFIILINVFISKLKRQVWRLNKNLAFIYTIIIVFGLITSLIIKYRPGGLYMIPLAIIPVLLKTFFDSKLALYIHCMVIILFGFWAPNSFEFIMLNILAGAVIVLSLSNTYRRNRMFFSAMWQTLTLCLTYIGLTLYQEGSLTNINTDNLLYFGGNGLLMLSALPLIYIFEKIFGYISDATLLELSDTNQTLLRKMAEVTPGTFQHSLQVANLSEEAIFKIGGNVLLVRAGALYHDIGKIHNPAYFIENLSDEVNPHESLAFEESAKIIINHVTKGVELAEKFHLPAQITDFIKTHHGTSLAHYFYRSYLNQNPGTEVDIKQFKYPGPKPFSREMAVVMIADSVEAATRSLKHYSEVEINNMVDIIVNGLIADDQLADADLTFRDIEIIKKTLKQRLKTIYHFRIEYPKSPTK